MIYNSENGEATDGNSLEMQGRLSTSQLISGRLILFSEDRQNREGAIGCVKTPLMPSKYEGSFRSETYYLLPNGNVEKVITGWSGEGPREPKNNKVEYNTMPQLVGTRAAVNLVPDGKGLVQLGYQPLEQNTN